jgi:hypothetical protein
MSPQLELTSGMLCDITKVDLLAKLLSEDI